MAWKTRSSFRGFLHRRETSKSEEWVLCPSPPAQGTLWGEWPPSGNWESGCMCGHAGRPGPPPPYGQPGGLLISRDGFQSHGVPLIKQTSISWWPEGSGRRPSLRVPTSRVETLRLLVLDRTHTHTPLPPDGSPHKGIWAAAVHRAETGGPSLGLPSTRLELHPASSLLCPLTSPTLAPNSSKQGFLGHP